MRAARTPANCGFACAADLASTFGLVTNSRFSCIICAGCAAVRILRISWPDAISRKCTCGRDRHHWYSCAFHSFLPVRRLLDNAVVFSAASPIQMAQGSLFNKVGLK